MKKIIEYLRGKNIMKTKKEIRIVVNYWIPTGSFFVPTIAEEMRSFKTYHRGDEKPERPVTAMGMDNGWSPVEKDAKWVCEKIALIIDEGVWGEVLEVK